MTDGIELGRGDQARLVADQLRRDIIAGTLAPGSRLGQDGLARRFGLSRMPVRAALSLLEAEGLVEQPANRSATVALLDAADMNDIFDMRIALETLALRLALPQISNAVIDSAQAIHVEIEGAGSRGFGDLNAAFHMTLYTPCGRPRLLSQIDRLGGLADRYLRLAVSSRAQRARSDREHVALIELCRQRDADGAVQVLRDHIATARDMLTQVLKDGRT